MFSKFIDSLNNNRAKAVAVSFIKLVDETMPAWHSHKDKMEGLPIISFILQKLELLGTEFKSIPCSLTGIYLLFNYLRFLEAQRFKREK